MEFDVCDVSQISRMFGYVGEIFIFRLNKSAFKKMVNLRPIIIMKKIRTSIFLKLNIMKRAMKKIAARKLPETYFIEYSRFRNFNNIDEVVLKFELSELKKLWKKCHAKNSPAHYLSTDCFCYFTNNEHEKFEWMTNYGKYFPAKQINKIHGKKFHEHILTIEKYIGTIIVDMNDLRQISDAGSAGKYFRDIVENKIIRQMTPKLIW